MLVTDALDLALAANTTVSGAGTGGLTISAGSVVLLGTGSLGTGNVTLSGTTTLTLGNNTAAGNDNAGLSASQTVTLGAGTTLQTSQTNTPLTYNAFQINVTGSATLNFAGGNVYTTTTLTLNQAGTARAAEFDLAGQSQTLAGLTTGAGAGVATSAVVNSTNATASTLTLNVGGGITDVFAGRVGLSGANNIAVTMGATSTGVETFSGTDIYTGATMINGGILDFQTVASLPGGATPTTAITAASGAGLGLGVGTGGFTSTQVDAIRNISGHLLGQRHPRAGHLDVEQCDQ